MNEIPDEIFYWLVKVLQNKPGINPKETPLGVVCSYYDIEHNTLAFVAGRVIVLYDNDIPDWQLQVLYNQNKKLKEYL